MCPAIGWASERKNIYKNETEVRGILAISLLLPSLKFENEAHPAWVHLVLRVAFIWPTLGTYRPQRQILCSASNGVNSSVGLCFFVVTYRNDLNSVGGHKKNTDLQKKMEHSRLFCSHSVLPTKMNCGNLIIFVFLEYHSGWP